MRKLSVLVLLCITVFVLAGCNFFAPKGVVSGTVTDKITNQPLAGVEVSIGEFKATTTDNGTYTLTDIKVGEVNITASKEGYADYNGKVLVEKKKTTTHNIILASTLEGKVIGTITDGDTSAPVANATITIGNKSVKSDAQGNYSITNVAIGSRDIKVSATGYVVYTGKVTVEAAKTATANAALIVAGFVKGYVTDGQGGPGLEGATVTHGAQSITTDAKGYFELAVIPDKVNDLLVTKDGRATSKVQKVVVGKGETVEYSIPNRAPFNPRNSFEAPTITILGVTPGEEISGSKEITVKATGKNPIYAIYLYFDGMQRAPRDLAAFEVSEGKATINTALYPNGDRYVRALVYDTNENAAMLIVSVKVNNAADDTEVPADMASMKILSLSFGQNIGFYKKAQTESYKEHNIKGNPNYLNAKHGIKYDLNSAPAGATLINKVSWGKSTGADGYSVYRSFDGTNYSLMSNTKELSYDDFSPALEVGKKTWYKIVPYNSFGKGKEIVRSITPIPAFNVELVGPANGENGVSLTPTYTWKYAVPEGQFPEGTYFLNYLTVYDVTDYRVWEAEYIEGTEITSDIKLQPMCVYSWDIISSVAENDEDFVDPNNYSIALSASGEYTGDLMGTGSINGEFVFTTLNPVK